MTFEQFYDKALICAVSQKEEEKYLAIKYLNEAIKSLPYNANDIFGKDTYKFHLAKFMVGIAKHLNGEELLDSEYKAASSYLARENLYNTTIRNHIVDIWLKSIKFDLLMGELQNMRDKIGEGKEQLQFIEEVVEIATKYLPEKTIE